MSKGIRYGLPLPASLLLEGPRVVLRQPIASDYSEWAALRGESRAFLTPWEPLWPTDAISEGGYNRRIRRGHTEWREDEGYSFHVFTRAGLLLGGIGLSQVRRGIAQTAVLGYWIGQRHARQGYTGEATRLVLDLAFRKLGLHRVEASFIPDNIASRTLLERAGFRQEGFARAYLKIAGEWADHLLYAILEDEWQALQDR